MALWTDLISPAELTGYVRTALSDLEINQPSLARYLPNEEVADIAVRFVVGRAGLVAEASFRAFDAAPELAGGLTGARKTLELPAIGQRRVISEYDQLRNRNASDETLRDSILKEARNVAKAIADRMERLRGTVLETGKATVNQANFGFDDDFGRTGTHTTAAGTLWSTGPTVSRLTDLTAWMDIYSASNDGALPGVMLMSRKGFRALASGDEFSLILANGTKRPGDRDSINATLDREGLPPIEIYDRSTSGGRVISENKLLFLPAPVDTNGDSELGKSYWGRTLTSMDPEYGLADSEQPGVVVGANKSATVPHIATVESDGIALPVLGNADLSFAARIIT